MTDMNDKLFPDLHDAIIDGVEIDFNNHTAVIYIKYYKSDESANRINGNIKFSNVSFAAQNFSISDLDINKTAGNVSYWIPSANFGSTYIYLVQGYIQITSDPPSLLENEAPFHHPFKAEP